MAPKRVAFLVVGEGIEKVELTEPQNAVTDGGHEAVLLSIEVGGVQPFEHLDSVDIRPADALVGQAKVGDVDALVLPGGVANPDALRTDKDAVSFVAHFVASGRPLTAICHSSWTLIEADVLRGTRLTSWPSLQTDICNAGGTWVDQSLVVDGNLISSRSQDDLPDFC